ncbi:amidohydrolase family protein [Streptomyces sp. NPDC048441]|uniref:amidohydrolase family protein n=1 Tax=Streptomyces sp. NPDC048441 TaxID=3365552 RepID=UPI003710A84E
MSQVRHIDVHHHFIPEFYRDIAGQAGHVLSGGAPIPPWTPGESLAMLDDAGIEFALLSIAPPGVYFGDPAAAAALATRCNDHLAELIKEHPGRFGGFGVLPLPDVDAALAEIDRIFDVHRLDGVGLYTNVAGRYLGDPAFEPVFAELNRRRAVAYLHPAEPPVDPAPGLGLPGWYGEFVFDTTRALSQMIVQGTLSRHRDVSLIVAHAGGTAPAIVQRIENVRRTTPDAAQETSVDFLKRLYFDTASCGAGHGLRLVRDLVGTERILVGSDYPFVPPHSVGALTKNLADPRFLGVGPATLRENTVRLFPRLG